MSTILVPVDLSPVTERVVEAALKLALALGGRITLVHVLRPPVFVNEYSVVLERKAPIAESAANNEVEGLRQEVQRGGVTADVVQCVGSPAIEILQQAQRTRCSWIVMGSHGHTALYELFVGSTTRGVLGQAPCPVIIVPAGVGMPDPEKHKKNAASAASLVTGR